MLKHAKSLKKMVIVHSPEQSSVARKLLKTYRKSNVRIVLENDQKRRTDRSNLERIIRRVYQRKDIEP